MDQNWNNIAAAYTRRPAILQFLKKCNILAKKKRIKRISWVCLAQRMPYSDESKAFHGPFCKKTAFLKVMSHKAVLFLQMPSSLLFMNPTRTCIDIVSEQNQNGNKSLPVHLRFFWQTKDTNRHFCMYVTVLILLHH